MRNAIQGGYVADWRAVDPEGHVMGAAVYRQVMGGHKAFLRCNCGWANVIAVGANEEQLIDCEAELHLTFWHDEAISTTR